MDASSRSTTFSFTGLLFFLLGIQLVHLLPPELLCTTSRPLFLSFFPRLHDASCHLPWDDSPGWKTVNRMQALTITAPSKIIKVICRFANLLRKPACTSAHLNTDRTKIARVARPKAHKMALNLKVFRNRAKLGLRWLSELR